MQNYQRQIALKFKLLASFYDLFDLVFRLDRNRNPRYALARKIPNQPWRILDVCAGTGNSAIVVAEANDRNEIIGIDLSADMIAVAESKIRKRRLGGVRIEPMDATRMSFQDGEFDVAMVSFGLHELDYPLMMRILKEMCRVLKDGGKLYIVDYEREAGVVTNLLFSAYLWLFEPRHMAQFLRYDWTKILLSVGIRVDGVEKHFFSKLISATKPCVGVATAP